MYILLNSSKNVLHCIELGNVELKVGFIEMLTFA